MINGHVGDVVNEIVRNSFTHEDYPVDEEMYFGKNIDTYTKSFCFHCGRRCIAWRWLYDATLSGKYRVRSLLTHQVCACGQIKVLNQVTMYGDPNETE